MKKIELTLDPKLLDRMESSLDALGVRQVSICDILVHSQKLERRSVYRGTQYVADAPMLKIEFFVNSYRLEDTVRAIRAVAASAELLVFDVASVPLAAA